MYVSSMMGMAVKLNPISILVPKRNPGEWGGPSEEDDGLMKCLTLKEDDGDHSDDSYRSGTYEKANRFNHIIGMANIYDGIMCNAAVYWPWVKGYPFGVDGIIRQDDPTMEIVTRVGNRKNRDDDEWNHTLSYITMLTADVEGSKIASPRKLERMGGEYGGWPAHTLGMEYDEADQIIEDYGRTSMDYNPYATSFHTTHSLDCPHRVTVGSVLLAP